MISETEKIAVYALLAQNIPSDSYPNLAKLELFKPP